MRLTARAWNPAPEEGTFRYSIPDSIHKHELVCIQQDPASTRQPEFPRIAGEPRALAGMRRPAQYEQVSRLDLRAQITPPPFKPRRDLMVVPEQPGLKEARSFSKVAQSTTIICTLMPASASCLVKTVAWSKCA